MKNSTMTPGSVPTDPLNLLLADIAIHIQLSQAAYERAVSRYETMSTWIDREGSPLRGRVDLLYPQGSMAIAAAIASKLTDDEYDIDIVAELDLPASSTPQFILDCLYQTIRGEPGSRYYRMVKRRTRCVTVEYGDMHLDITPAVRRVGMPERESYIFHDRAEDPTAPSFRCIANPFGFAEWFIESTPAEADFGRFFSERATAYERQFVVAKATSEPVPPQLPPLQRSRAVIVLQLLKRWRNVCYDGRLGRRPPSVLLSKLVADAANETCRLSDELVHQSRHLLDVFKAAQNCGQLVHATNPSCPSDVLTDRWPGALKDQDLFVRDLEGLVRDLHVLTSGCSLDQMRAILARLFGEGPTWRAIRAFNEAQIGHPIRNGSSRHYPNGGLAVPAGLGVAPHVTSRRTPRNTFYGANDP